MEHVSEKERGAGNRILVLESAVYVVGSQVSLNGQEGCDVHVWLVVGGVNNGTSFQLGGQELLEIGGSGQTIPIMNHPV